MNWPRIVVPEVLDELPASDPEAQHSRRDLYMVNRIMRNDVHMARCLRQLAGQRPPKLIIDLGSGDGRFTLRVARRLAPHWPAVRIQLLDRQSAVTPEVLAGFRDLGWHAEQICSDLWTWLESSRVEADIITANLFLHHFTEVQLQQLCTELAARTSGIVATEPWRSRIAWAGAHLLGLLGCNRVTRHDAVVSVRAGFVARELAALWPQDGWKVQESWLAPFTHGLVAGRSA